MQFDFLELKTEDMRRRNRLSLIVFCLAVVLGFIAVFKLKIPFEKGFPILLVDTSFTAIVASLYFSKRGTFLIPYISAIGMFCISLVNMVNTPSVSNLVLFCFSLIVTSIYMRKEVFIFGFLSQFGLFLYYMKTYAEILSIPDQAKGALLLYFILITAILLSQQRISNHLIKKTFEMFSENEEIRDLLRREKEREVLFKTHSNNISNNLKTIQKNGEFNKTSLKEMSNSFQDINVIMHENISEIVNHTKQTNEIIENLTFSTNNLKEKMQKTNQLSVEGEKTINTLTTTINTFRESISSASSEIGSLSEKINLISNFTNSIQEISSKSEILALNASIEAAKAGEHGKGFAIVALEVGKLAELTSKSASNITETIKILNAQTKITQNQILENVKKMESSIEMTENSKKSFSTISSSIQDLNEETNKNNLLISKMGSSSEEIQHSIHNFATHIQEISNTLSHLNHNIEQQLNEQDNLIELINNNNDSFEDLSRMFESNQKS